MRKQYAAHRKMIPYIETSSYSTTLTSYVYTQVQSSFNGYDIACKLVRFLRLSAHPGSFINCHSRIEEFLHYIVTDDVQALLQMILSPPQEPSR